MLARRRDAILPPPIFVLAVPRSGSTLTYQCLVHAFGISYLSNLGNLLAELPYTGGRVSDRRCAGRGMSFHSDRGFVPGLCGPAEGKRFWETWGNYGLSDASSAGMTVGRGKGAREESDRIAYLRRALAALTTLKRPFASAYLGHTLDPIRLRQEFPEALFLRLRRDPLANGLSLQRCREESEASWFSLFPRECKGIETKSVAEQIAAQVTALNARLDCLDKDERTFWLDYENLCRDPNAEMEKFRTFANSYGLDLQWISPLPPKFPIREIDEEDERVSCMREALAAVNLG